MTVPTKTTSNPDTPTVGRWTKREHELFLEGLQRFGKSWKKISSLVHTRTLVQIRTHAQKYLQKQTRAAIKADAKAAEAALRAQSRSTFKHSDRSILPTKAVDPPTLQMNPPMLRQWKSPYSEDHSEFTLANSQSNFQLHNVNRLDQLLQDDHTIPFVDEQYTSPTAIEDGLFRPLYTREQWMQRLAQSSSTSYPNKRRRVEPSTSSLPVLRPAIPSATFEPLPAPDNLSSPTNSSLSAAALLAAHETEETTTYNAWL
ncbi:hypothetical protein PHMEG_00016364 [Phytophthora megakarya]|uniref:Uncharacterized protein n=1 Tax=Phytophthora megakarya TaxID=4795 RepID=A0A225VZ07_9STRA|nr:hypothetical protein PHMEG_00016364 [Phytophthora megakarya]